MRIGRRAFALLLVVAAAGLGAAGRQHARRTAARPPPAVLRLALRFRDLLHDAAALEGLGQLRAESADAPTLEHVLSDLGFGETSREPIARWTDEQLTQHLRLRIEVDFASMRLVSVGGWLMPRTEAAICLLLFHARGQQT